MSCSILFQVRVSRFKWTVEVRKTFLCPVCCSKSCFLWYSFFGFWNWQNFVVVLRHSRLYRTKLLSQRRVLEKSEKSWSRQSTKRKQRTFFTSCTRWSDVQLNETARQHVGFRTKNFAAKFKNFAGPRNLDPYPSDVRSFDPSVKCLRKQTKKHQRPTPVFCISQTQTNKG